MPTYLQLEAEPYWAAEFAPPNLQAFYKGLRAYLGVGPDAVGGKGDNNHLRGYHRSRRWIRSSRFSLYGLGDYSIQHPLDQGGDDDWFCALDATPKDTATLIAMCKRLDAAVKAGQLPQVREWYGNVDGDQVVDGWDAVAKKAATSDSSHLWHLHISFFRSRADWDHSNLLAVLTGEDMAWTDKLGPTSSTTKRWPDGAADTAGNWVLRAAIYAWDTAAAVTALSAVVKQLGDAIKAGGGTVDTAAILAGVDSRLAELRHEIEADTRDAVADAAEGGAAGVRGNA